MAQRQAADILPINQTETVLPGEQVLKPVNTRQEDLLWLPESTLTAETAVLAEGTELAPVNTGTQTVYVQAAAEAAATAPAALQAEQILAAENATPAWVWPTAGAAALLAGGIALRGGSDKGSSSGRKDNNGGNDTPIPPVIDPDIINNAPTNITLSASTLPENTVGARIGRLTTTDADTNDTHTYTVSDKRFEVVNGYLKLKAGQKIDYANEQSVKLTVTTTDSAGAKYSKAFTVQVQDDPNYPTPNQAAQIRISGKAEVGQELTATVSDGNGVPGKINYQWYADGQAISGAIAAKYTLAPTDAGKTITVKATFTDKDGYAENPASQATEQIAKAPVGVYVPAAATDFVANVKDYGAKGDGKTDDTKAIQAAVDAVVAKGGGIVDIPAGTFAVDALQSIRLGSNVIVRMGDDTVVKVIPNDAHRYAVFNLNKVDNTHIIGGTIVGDRDEHTGSGGEWGMGVRVLDSSKVVIEGVTVKKMWGDGIYLGQGSTRASQNEDITIYQVTADHNRRQGISVVHGKGIKILNSEFKNTDGTDPRAGIDLEPNEGQQVRDVEISGNVFGNNRIGVLVINHKYPSSAISDVTIRDNTFVDNKRGILLRGLEGGEVSGNTIHHDHREGTNEALYGISIQDGIRPSKDVEISGNTIYGGNIIDRNTSGNSIENNIYKSQVYIRGDAQKGEKLTAQVYDGDRVPGSSQIEYQWFANGVKIAGATGASYTPVATDKNKVLTVKVEFTDLAGHRESAVSTPSQPVGTVNSNHAPTDLILQGTALAENSAGATVGKLSVIDRDIGDTHSYQVSDARFEVVNGYLKLKAGQKIDYAKEQSVKLIVTTTDSAGAKYSKAFTVQVQDDPNYPTPNQSAQVRISGKAEVGQVLTATVSDGNGVPSKINYQWYAAGKAISGATQQTYTPQWSDVGKTLSVEARYTDPHGHAEKPLSSATATVKYGIYTHPEYGRYVDAREFGADPSGKTDSSNAFQAALKAAHEHKVALYFGEGQFTYSQALKMNGVYIHPDNNQTIGGKFDNITALFGAGTGKTQLTYIAKDTFTDKESPAIALTNMDNKKVGDFKLVSTILSDPSSVKQGVEIKPDKVSGIVIADGNYNTVQRVDVSGNNSSGVSIGGWKKRIEADAKWQQFERGEISGDKLDLPIGNKVIDSKLYKNGVAGLSITFQQYFTADGNTLSENGREGYAGLGYGIAMGVGSYNHHITVTNNITENNVRKGIDAHDGDYLVIKNNVLKGDYLYGIAMSPRTFGMREVEVSDNIIYADAKKTRTHDLKEQHYWGIFVHSKSENLDKYHDSRLLKIKVENNQIYGLEEIRKDGQSMVRGITVDNYENVPYQVSIKGNVISGTSPDQAISFSNGYSTTTTPVVAGELNISDNKINLGTSSAAPIYISEAGLNPAGQSLAGKVVLQGNQVTLDKSNQSSSSAEIVQVIGHRAAEYDISGNTFRLLDDATTNNSLVKINTHGTPFSGNAVIKMTDNAIHTPLPDLSRLNNTHSKDDSGNSWMVVGPGSQLTVGNNTHNGETITQAPRIKEAKTAMRADMRQSADEVPASGEEEAAALPTLKSLMAGGELLASPGTTAAVPAADKAYSYPLAATVLPEDNNTAATVL
ncbi:parallel beta-helix repeat protein/VCBS repeat-containing protein [Neisseria sp. HSC-16F19]|nr:right-handed parallel beta-helix repeat-containing protein [Neisseria sp. HSC-16F19]MCP2041638.1 parallel beta-helix repeat protein/VCBS repeat-containing protein [Neisseria sp. HSC-16F19]